MEAGRGAQQQVERLEAKVEQARRALANAEQQLYAWRQGAEGERRTGEVLALLASSGWVVLHDLHWPGRPFANIDHIAIGPTGVFVIDSKHWTGDVQVRDGVLRQNGHRRTDACEGAASATAAVAAFLEPGHRSLTSAVLCLVGQGTPPDQPQFARVVGLDDLPALLTTGPIRLAAGEVAQIAHHLRRLLSGPRSPEQATTDALLGAGAPPSEPRPARRARRSGRTSRPAGHSRKRRGAKPSSRRGKALGALQLAVIFIALVTFAPRLLTGLAESVTHQPSVAPTATTAPTHKKPTTPPSKRKPAATRTGAATSR